RSAILLRRLRRGPPSSDGGPARAPRRDRRARGRLWRSPAPARPRPAHAVGPASGPPRCLARAAGGGAGGRLRRRAGASGATLEPRRSALEWNEPRPRRADPRHSPPRRPGRARAGGAVGAARSLSAARRRARPAHLTGGPRRPGPAPLRLRLGRGTAHLLRRLRLGRRLHRRPSGRLAGVGGPDRGHPWPGPGGWSMVGMDGRPLARYLLARDLVLRLHRGRRAPVVRRGLHGRSSRTLGDGDRRRCQRTQATLHGSAPDLTVEAIRRASSTSLTLSSTPVAPGMPKKDSAAFRPT